MSGSVPGGYRPGFIQPNKHTNKQNVFYNQIHSTKTNQCFPPPLPLPVCVSMYLGPGLRGREREEARAFARARASEREWERGSLDSKPDPRPCNLEFVPLHRCWCVLPWLDAARVDLFLRRTYFYDTKKIDRSISKNWSEYLQKVQNFVGACFFNAPFSRSRVSLLKWNSLFESTLIQNISVNFNTKRKLGVDGDGTGRGL